MPAAEIPLESLHSETVHEITIRGRPIAYTAQVGSLPTKNASGQETGRIFYIAYRKSGVAEADHRPVTFAFNGGPGCASLWIHMGAFGPKRVLSLEDGRPASPPYLWIDNEDSILDLTDLVFIDPIGTGFSRPADEKKESFFSTEGDIQSIGDFIRDYVTQEGLWKSPKFIAGESYGTLRACGLSEYLISEHGLFLNGLILISCAIDYQTLICDLDNELPYAFYLPTYAATAWFHHKFNPTISLEQIVEQARHFAIDVFAPALLRFGTGAPDLLAEIAYWTGLTVHTVQEHMGLIDESTYILEFLRDQNKVIGCFDTRSMGEIIPPRTIENYEDPSCKNAGAYIAAINAYLRDDLRCGANWPRYEIDMSHPWNFGSFGYPNMMNRLRRALVLNPEMRVFTACGYFDLTTPFTAAEYCFKRLHLPLTDHITFGYYEGGHMFYSNPAALKQFRNDLQRFYQPTGERRLPNI